MSMHFVLDTFTYTVKDTAVTARAVIGNAQAGGWKMTLDDQLLAKGDVAKDVKLGNGKDVRGKQLQVQVTVVDINKNTNRTSSKVTLAGGAPATDTYAQTFDDGGDGDTTVFTFLVDLV